MQPQGFDEFVGQQHLLSHNKPLRRLIEEDKIVSVIFFGPPGTGKTALAHIIARRTNARFIAINAVTAGIKDIREAVESSRGERAILFVDEIHRFNKTQQDALLPHVEKGEIILVGASTQNPYFSLVPALSSRSLIFPFKPIPAEELRALLLRALSDAKGLGKHNVSLHRDAADYIASVSGGDARKALNILELSFLTLPGEEAEITLDQVKEVTQNRSIYYDEDDHYNTISAFIKSMRGSDPDATVYWMAKMIESGEDPLFIARRIVICAAEDVGNADPRALTIAVSAMEAFQCIGLPEGELALAQTAVYLATAPKSNSLYVAYGRVKGAISETGTLPVPLHIRNAPTRLMKDIGYGEDYQYAHDFEDAYVPQDYLPGKLQGSTYYIPTDRGYEKVIKERMEQWRKLRESMNAENKKKKGET